MLTRSLVVATAVLAFAAIPLSAVQAKSNNSHGNSSANHQGSQGNSASVKSGNSSGTHSGSTKSTQAQAKQKKKPRTSLGPIIFTKHYDKSSP
jgi:type VI protein secretion system component Hcp